jgi:polyhydroxyalkanoate synthesis repressor PhaR
MTGKRKKKAAAKTTRRGKTRGKPAGREARRDPPPAAASGVVTIRKYANRRLYDTAASKHITQEDLYRMVSRGAVVRILDAATEEDITNQTLALALIEHDPAKLRLMPAWLLHQMIRLHEQALGGWLSPLWQPLSGGHATMPGWPTTHAGWPAATGPMSFGAWNPWAIGPPPTGAGTASQPAEPSTGDQQTREDGIDELRREVSQLLRRLGELEGRG